MILAMPGWQSGNVSSVVVTRVDGTVEVLGGNSRSSFLEDLLGEPDAPKREPVPPSATPGPPGLAPPPAPPPPEGAPPASSTGLPAAGSGKKRRKRRAVAVSEAPPGVPQAVFEHHWEHVHQRGQQAAVEGDVSYVLRQCAEAGCHQCMLLLLQAHLADGEDLIRRTGTGGYDCSAWAEWGAEQARKVKDWTREIGCKTVQSVLDRMKEDSVAAVVGEWEYEDSEDSGADPEAPWHRLPALEDS